MLMSAAFRCSRNSKTRFRETEGRGREEWERFEKISEDRGERKREGGTRRGGGDLRMAPRENDQSFVCNMDCEIIRTFGLDMCQR